MERADGDVYSRRPFVQEVGRDPRNGRVDPRRRGVLRLRGGIHGVEGDVPLTILDSDLGEDGRSAPEYAEADLDPDGAPRVGTFDRLAVLADHADGQEARKIVPRR